MFNKEEIGNPNYNKETPESHLEIENKIIEPASQEEFKHLNRDVVLANTKNGTQGLSSMEAEDSLLYAILGMPIMSQVTRHSFLAFHVISRGIEGKGMESLITQRRIITDESAKARAELKILTAKGSGMARQVGTGFWDQGKKYINRG